MQAKLVRALPEGENWIYEVKWDGYRVEAIKHGDTVKLISRNAKNLTGDYPVVRDAVRGTNAHTSVLDGEIVALDEQGRPSFQALQHRSALAAGHHLVYFAFDLLNLNGKNLRDLPLHVRKAELAKVLTGTRVQFSADLIGPPAAIIEAIKGAGLEGSLMRVNNYWFLNPAPYIQSVPDCSIHFQTARESFEIYSSRFAAGPVDSCAPSLTKFAQCLSMFAVLPP